LSSRGLILVYHAIEEGPPPLFLSPERFRDHVETIVASGASPLGLDQVADGLAGGDLPERWVAVTFDDAYASVPRSAAPALAQAGVPAAVFCVAGRMGADNRWPGQPPRVPVRSLCTAEEIAALAGAGWTVGSHGLDHARLDTADSATLEREIVESRARLEEATASPVSWFAHPYGVPPAVNGGRRLLEATYRGACGTTMRFATGRSAAYALPRVDAHYLRRPALLADALRGGRAYLALRRAAARLGGIAAR
jgi:peptidoglycan/xylan/chitin deacetylase (PgdA/CDA1 family)